MRAKLFKPADVIAVYACVGVRVSRANSARATRVRKKVRDRPQFTGQKQFSGPRGHLAGNSAESGGAGFDPAASSQPERVVPLTPEQAGQLRKVLATLTSRSMITVDTKATKLKHICTQH